MDAIAGELLSGLIGLVVLILGWGHIRMTGIHKRIDDLDAKKVNASDLHEFRSDVKTILKEITNLKVEQALWRGRTEQQESNRLGKS